MEKESGEILFADRNILLLVVLLVGIILLSGCAGTKVSAPPSPVFFPPIPNPPRIQYLTRISSSRDVDNKKLGGLALVAVGDSQAEKVKPIVKPFGITVHGGKIYVCDTTAGRVIIIDPAKKSFDFLKGNYSFGKLKKPIGLELDQDNNLYVADSMRKEVLVYGPSGNFLRSFGKSLEMKPVDVAIDGEYLYVLDIKNHDVKILNRKTGKLEQKIGKTASGKYLLAMPISIDTGPKGSVFVSNMTSGKIVNLDRDGHLLGEFGKLGDGFGQFGRPKGVVVDDHGRIYVVDAAHQNVQIFNEKGRLLMFFGDPGLPFGSLNLPAGIAVTSDGIDLFRQYIDPAFQVEQLIFVTSQFGPAKISVYGLGQLKH
jgi:DNA-binding beta-propeller fold protein YncE